MSEITSIGVVERETTECVPPKELRDDESTIIVDTEYAEGLYRIEENDYLVVVFHLHLSDGYTLRGDRLYGSERGVFASRSPNRPGKVGVTTVELLERDGRRLRVWGLDAVDGTPILDIKPYVPDLDGLPTVEREGLDDPRAGVDRNVRHRDLESLFVDSAALHGGYCPLLAAGVLAATYAARDLSGRTTRGLVASVETGSDGNSCPVDAVQYVLGATAGSRRLVVRDAAGGKDALALTVVVPTGSAVRVEIDTEALQSVLSVETVDCQADVDGSDNETLRDAAFALLDRPLSDVGTVDSNVEPPAWVPDLV